TIHGMMSQLKTHPPAWILYERQPRILRLDEIFYNQGRRIPHRDLDEFIVERVRSSAWRVVTLDRMHADDSWFLIRTAPIGSNR
ncbi:MAG TPA: hypothetical protein VGF33_03710, partial [Caulobacteraceae bacterium]